jgi:hypothetical protein
MVARRYYQMVTIATAEDMMSPKIVATEATAVMGGSVTSPRSTVEMGQEIPIAKVRPPQSLQRRFVVVKES